MERIQPVRGSVCALLLAGWMPAATAQACLAASARTQLGVTVLYDPAYVRLAYPGGDVPIERGVCTDVLIRAYRQHGIDLQQRVHEDMRAHFAAYPPLWGLSRPDRNIDHRRVPNLARYFTRHGRSLGTQSADADFQAGDLVTWRLDSGVPHIGIVSDRRNPEGRPLIVHNIGAGTQEEDVLREWTITGHYRYRPEAMTGCGSGADRSP